LKANAPRYEIQASFFKALGHPRRLQIIHLLSQGGKTVNEIAKILKISQSNVSQHLAILRSSGIVQYVRKDHNIYYSISDQRINELCEMVCDILKSILSRDYL